MIRLRAFCSVSNGGNLWRYGHGRLGVTFDQVAKQLCLPKVRERQKMTTVLIIDDDESIRDGMCAFLQLEEYKTLEAPNGSYGIDLLKRNPVDVLVTDIHMPRKQGWETIVEARRRWPSIKIIAMSGGANGVGTVTETDSEHYLPVLQELGADRFLRKFFKPDLLVETIRELISDEPEIKLAQQ